MEKIFILSVVFISIVALIWKFYKDFQKKDQCQGCAGYKECAKISVSEKFLNKDTKNE